MSIWTPLAEFVGRVSGKGLSNAVEAVRTLFAGDPELRRRVSFSIAMIALSAKNSILIVEMARERIAFRFSIRYATI